MVGLVRRLMQTSPRRKYLVIIEVLLLALLGGSIWLYSHFDPLFGKDEWTVTQYGPRDTNSSFYTIYNPKKGLIVVDGGWAEDAAYVARTIKRLGGKVDAWLITHPHQDHIGAFNALWTHRRGIKIEKVYTVEMASPEDCEAVAAWDNTEAYREFLTLDIPELTYVHTGDHLQLCSLSFDILSAFDEEVRTLSRDYINDGSMMFKVIGPQHSFLFCADVGKSMSRSLYRRYKGLLNSDYLQMGHHGNGGLKKKFYTAVSPSIAFFDAPDWLMYDETGSYDTPAKIELMESLGAQILSFNSAPNSVKI